MIKGPEIALNQEKTNLLWWTPEFTSMAGQAIVTSRVVKLIIDAGGNGVIFRAGKLRSLASWGIASVKIHLLSTRRRKARLYIVCSRSTIGFFRDIPAYVTRIYGNELVVHSHGTDIVDLCKRPLIGPLAKLALRASTIITPSRHLIASLRQLGFGRIVCCENFIAPRLATEPQGSSGAKSQSDDWIVYWNSNISRAKGFFAAAEAVETLRKNGRQVRLIAIGCGIKDADGSGSSYQRIIERMAALGWISYKGPVSQETSMELLTQADVVCLLSRDECQPLAILEAMGAGKPVVVSDIPGLRATIGDYPGRFVKVGEDPSVVGEALVEEAQRGRDEPEVFEESAEAARQRFSAERFDREMREILTK